MNDQMKQAAGQEMALVIPTVEALGKLKSMKPCFSLTTKYKTSDDWAALKDKPLQCYYMGIKEIPNEDGEVVNCGVFVSENEVFLSGQKILVDAVKNLPIPSPLQITYIGKKQNKSSEGSTMIFDVEKLA